MDITQPGLRPEYECPASAKPHFPAGRMIAEFFLRGVSFGEVFFWGGTLSNKKTFASGSTLYIWGARRQKMIAEYNIACCYAQMGDAPKAMEMLRTYIGRVGDQLNQVRAAQIRLRPQIRRALYRILQMLSS